MSRVEWARTLEHVQDTRVFSVVQTWAWSAEVFYKIQDINTIIAVIITILRSSKFEKQ